LLKGAKRHSRTWAFNFSFDFGTSGHPQRRPQKVEKVLDKDTYAYFVREPRWKLYDDGRLYDMAKLPAPPKQCWPASEWKKISPIQPEDDTAETKVVRARLEAVFTKLQLPGRTTIAE